MARAWNIRKALSYGVWKEGEIRLEIREKLPEADWKNREKEENFYKEKALKWEQKE